MSKTNMQAPAGLFERGLRGLVSVLALCAPTAARPVGGGRAPAGALPGSPARGDIWEGVRAGAAPACRPGRHDKVALLFLTRGAVTQEPVYAAWFADAAMLRPFDALAAAACTEDDMQAWQRCAPSPDAVRADPIGAQDLFSVHVHPAPDFAGMPPGSIFARSVLPPAERIATHWGEHSLVEAHRQLLRAALVEPRNKQFVLLSDSDVPLYPSSLVYVQLVHERRSRINACETGNHDTYRYHPGMDDLAGVAVASWRKSGQFAGLRREHAQLLADEQAVARAFAALCYWRAHDDRLGRSYVCYGDEHYAATTLAHLGRGHETDCSGRAMRVVWPKEHSAHPLSFGAGNVTAALIARLRGGDRCSADAAAAMHAAEQQLFQVGVPPAQAQRRCAARPPFDPAPLQGNCSLFARKFTPDATPALVTLFGDCAAGDAAAIAGCRSGGAVG